MGLLIDGVWHDQWYDTKSTGGRFKRESPQYRNWITPDGAPGPTGEGGFPAASGRYHLYVSLACPWAHRALIFRRLKGLEEAIGVSVVHPHMLENGWEYAADTSDDMHRFEGTGDPVNGARYHHQLYTMVDPHYTGRVTVPLLWDRERATIVSNESADIIRMFNSGFVGVAGNDADFYPEDLRETIEAINEPIYHRINNGVYKTGFATTQDAYEEAFDDLFAELDHVDARLADNRYLCGERITEADWRLFTTLIRFDAVYVGHFKCNRQRIADYPNLSGYLRELYQWPGVRETVNFEHIKQHYYYSHGNINPTRVVPKGPTLDLESPHGRG
ncbi:glutathione S-transferase family protein [Halofilum ochraceum]|uniref:glutathione S-transferase family protein n=1 Tax=Halofilum ochraceum TaxID=1611323 RepID=UPI0008D9C54A|nr:glutathione S-transferase family protein [Halofilum ochraceum]